MIRRRENHKPGAMGRKKVSPRNRSAVDKPVATEIPSILNISTAAASNVPRPPGIMLMVRKRFAIMKLAKTWLRPTVAPSDRTSIQSVAASRRKVIS